jgi:hypothetical protein
LSFKVGILHRSRPLKPGQAIRLCQKQFAELVTGFGFAPVGVGSRRDGGKLTQLDGPLMALNALTQNQRRLHACQSPRRQALLT